MTPQSLAHFHDLGVAFDGEPLFSGLSASLMPGLTGLVGRNGQGKSVLLAVLAGRRHPGSGSLHWAVPHLWLDQLDPVAGPRLADALAVGDLFDTFTRIDDGRGTPADLDRVADHWQRPAE